MTFPINEVFALSSYRYFRHFKMYKYAFTPKVCVRVVVLSQGRGGGGEGVYQGV